MHSLAEGIAAALGKSVPPPPPTVPTARELMQADGVVLRRHQSLLHVIGALHDHRVSGAPVVERHDELIGFVSEHDCLRAIAACTYDGEGWAERRRVEDVMSHELTTVPGSLNLYDIADVFLRSGRRRVPVVVGNRLIGQLSRAHVLAAVRSRCG